MAQLQANLAASIEKSMLSRMRLRGGSRPWSIRANCAGSTRSTIWRSCNAMRRNWRGAHPTASPGTTGRRSPAPPAPGTSTGRPR